MFFLNSRNQNKNVLERLLSRLGEPIYKEILKCVSDLPLVGFECLRLVEYCKCIDEDEAIYLVHSNFVNEDNEYLYY